MNRPYNYKPEDFAPDRGTQMIAMAVAMFYGLAVGIAGTLFVQWLAA